MSLGYVFGFKYLAFLWFKYAFFYQAYYILQAALQHVWFVIGNAQHVYAYHAFAAHHKYGGVVYTKLYSLTQLTKNVGGIGHLRSTIAYYASARGKRPYTFAHKACTYGIKYYVYTIAFGYFIYVLVKLYLAGINHMVCPHLFKHLYLAATAGGGKYLALFISGILHQRSAYPACGRVYQHAVAGVQVNHFGSAIVGGAVLGG
jgi:hypothetical protein